MDQNDYGGGGDEDCGSHLSLCHVSSSQEDHLRRCPHASVPYNSAADDDSSDSDDCIIVESTGIIMVSSPESMDSGDNSATHDVFQTPPENSTMLSSEEQHSLVAIGNREHDRSDDADSDLGFSEIEVGLGVDSDVDFSEIELTQWVHAQSSAGRSRRNVPRSELLEFQVSEECLHESQLKKSKIPEQNSAKSTNVLESDRVIPSNQDGSDEISKGQAKRRLEFRLEIEANHGITNGGAGEVNELQTREIMETMAMQKHVSTGDMLEMVDEHLLCRRRVLPSSILGNAETENENAANRVVSGGADGHRKFTVWDYLKTCSNESVPTGSFVEICKRHGMTFPCPRWWPEQGFKVDEGRK